MATTHKPNPYVPSFLRSAVSGSRPISITLADVGDTNAACTSSFRYDSGATPLKSTQQLNVDWSRFENHTFFMSAEAKVNLAFEAIINGFPFDGTRREAEAFFDNLTGFERWVFDSFPRFRGALAFVGNTGGGVGAAPETGTFIEVRNSVGALYPEAAPGSTGRAVLNPTGSQSMTIEAQLYVPTTTNDTQVVCQMMSGTTQGFSLHLLPASSTSSCEAQFVVVSGSTWLGLPVQVQKGRFNHVSFVLNRENATSFIDGFINAEKAGTSKTQGTIGRLDIDASPFLIGSGTAVELPSSTITPASTLSGTIDELRVFHAVRTAKQLAAYARRSTFAGNGLVLYYRFNEPPPPLASSASDPANAIVLDYSGNALHAVVSNFTGSLRIDASADPLNPMTHERAESSVVLFPAYPAITELNSTLLASASAYDEENPNLITKLVPQHYLLEGAIQDGFNEPTEGNAGQAYGGSGIPGQGRMGNAQIMASLLYVWARFFDEMKLFVDSFSTLRTVDYDARDTVPDNFLVDMVRSYGFHLPPLFADSTIEQYVRGDNLEMGEFSTSETSLRAVSNAIVRRILVNMPDVIRSKGTQHSIRSFLRAAGIDPNNSVRIREFGGPTTQQLSFARESRFEPGSMVQFSTSSLAVSPFLSSSRDEPGFPNVTGDASDGLLTSGSWTWEGTVRYTPQSVASMQSTVQSIVRLCVTGSTSGSSGGFSGIVANLVAVSSSVNPRLMLFLRPGDEQGSPLLSMQIDTPSQGRSGFAARQPGLFNYDKWNVSFGCVRGDDGINSAVSSSYFLRIASQNVGDIELLEATASYFQEDPTGNNVFRRICPASTHGVYIAMGPGQHVVSGTGPQYLHLNDYSCAPDDARTTSFDGRVSDVRFWSRALTIEEWKEHVRDRRSVGVRDPLVNWNYVHTRTGSFGRLRMNSMVPQETRRANATASLGELGAITFVDTSECDMHMTGTGFPIDDDCVVGEVFGVSHISAYFDEASSDQKVRVRSFYDQQAVDDTPWASPAPVYEIPASETPTDDVRLSVEFSLVDALNRDIVTILASMDAIDNAIGSPELLFSPDYPSLEDMRDVYFNRLKEKLNFQAFFEFFRWFDSSIGTFIQQLVPRKTKFKGTNFTVESHMLERAKQEYTSNQMYLGDSMRQNLDAVILLQQVEGRASKY